MTSSYFYGTAFGGGDTTCDPTNGGCGVLFKIGSPLERT